MANMFRKLKITEIEARVISEYPNGGVDIAVYKDARVDANILDETVGAMNWQKEYTNSNRNCILHILDNDTKRWISKEDVGEGQGKALASDSFKRAGFAWGIGRELYTCPHIYFRPEELSEDFSMVNDRFEITDIKYDGDSISSITVLNVTTGIEKVFNHENDRSGGKMTKGKPREIAKPERKETSGPFSGMELPFGKGRITA